MKVKLLVIGLCLILFSAFKPVDVSAHPPCGKVWIEGHHNRHGRWIRPHWKHLHWVHGHYSHSGRWIPGHCR